MHRSFATGLVLTCVLLSLPASGGQPTEKPASSPRAADGRPNIILLIGDDHGYPYFGFTGSEIVQTPSLDALANGGTTFLRTHNTASVCAPSLNTLLTGLYPVQWKSRLNQLRRNRRPLPRHVAVEGFATLPRVLAERGYVSFQAGKLWTAPAAAAGFTEGTVVEVENATHGGDKEFGRESIEPALRFMATNAGRPFFVWFAPMLPHVPLNAPKRFRAPYRGKKVSPTARMYYANCTWFDHLVGELVRFLDQNGLRENTMIVYLSDNGYDQPPTGKTPGTKGKNTMHEQGFRSPLIFNWPGHVPAGKAFDRFVSSTDIFPTLCSYAGVEKLPPGRMGIDLRPLIEGGQAAERRELIGQMNRKKTGGPRIKAFYLTNRRWHYVWKVSAGEEELFDKTKDPEEDHNVLEEHPDVAAELRARVQQWEREVTAPFAPSND